MPSRQRQLPRGGGGGGVQPDGQGPRMSLGLHGSEKRRLLQAAPPFTHPGSFFNVLALYQGVQSWPFNTSQVAKNLKDGLKDGPLPSNKLIYFSLLKNIF